MRKLVVLLAFVGLAGLNLGMWGIGFTEVAILMFMLLLPLLVLFLVVRAAMKSSSSFSAADESDREVVHEISGMVENMESRIDSLETILSDREKSEKNPLD